MVTIIDVDGTWAGNASNPVNYDAGELRRADAAMFSSAGIASGLAVSVDGSDVVTIQPGQAVISGEDAVVGTGVYRTGIAAAASGSLDARDATNGRIDLVVFRQLDPDVVPAHTARTSRIEVITGTPSATPAVPTKPSMAVELGRIPVPASGGGAASVDSSHRVNARAVGVSAPDTGWVALPNNVGGVEYRVRSGWVAVKVITTAATVSGTTYTISTAQLPAAYRPNGNRRGACDFSGYPGTMLVDATGNVLIVQNSGANRATIEGLVVYPVE